MIATVKSLSAYKYRQTTIQNAISCVGVGVHRGQKATLTLKPAPVNTGIVFCRTDVKDKNNLIKATYDNVVDTKLCSCIGNADGVTVSTIEHLMGAIFGYNITNLIVEIDGPEVPIMDGSAQDFLTLFDCAGVLEQDAPLMAVKILKEVSFADDKGAEVFLEPAAEGLELNFMIDFKQTKAIGRQEYSIMLTKDSFRDAIAYGRTFGFLKEVEMLRSMGLGKGGSLENAIVVDGDVVINPTGLRSDNEFVVHKTLDAVGDLYQLGMPIIGRFFGFKSGHMHTNMLLRKLMADKSAYEIVSMDDYMDSLLIKERKSA